MLRHDRNENPGTKIQRGQDGEWERDAAPSLQGCRHRSRSGESYREKATCVVSSSGLASELCLDAEKKELVVIEEHIFTGDKTLLCLEHTFVIDYRKPPL